MKKNILFLCTGNSCRSQMAKGLMRQFNGNDFEVYSAGTKPSEVNPYAIEVMKEIEIDISKQYSKSIDDLPKINFDYVITVCNNAKESCPFFPAGKMIHWDIEDPAEAKGSNEEILTVFRKTRDFIKKMIQNNFQI